MFMPFTFSITDGIGLGFLGFTIARAAQGRAREIHPFMWIASVLFVLYFAGADPPGHVRLDLSATGGRASRSVPVHYADRRCARSVQLR